MESATACSACFTRPTRSSSNHVRSALEAVFWVTSSSSSRPAVRRCSSGARPSHRADPRRRCSVRSLVDPRRSARTASPPVRRRRRRAAEPRRSAHAGCRSGRSSSSGEPAPVGATTSSSSVSDTAGSSRSSGTMLACRTRTGRPESVRSGIGAARRRAAVAGRAASGAGPSGARCGSTAGRPVGTSGLPGRLTPDPRRARVGSVGGAGAGVVRCRVGRTVSASASPSVRRRRRCRPGRRRRGLGQPADAVVVGAASATGAAAPAGRLPVGGRRRHRDGRPVRNDAGVLRGVVGCGDQLQRDQHDRGACRRTRTP